MNDKKTAFIFSGQGAQYAGMGRELYECSTAARTIFDSLEKQLPFIKELCFNPPEGALKITKNIQPCTYAVSLAAAAALKENGIVPSAAAGFSLGEVSALTYAGVFSLSGGFDFVLKRAEIMQSEAEKSDCSMAAVLGLDEKTVEAAAKEFKNVYLVNFNCPMQIVASGETENLNKFSQKINSLGGRVIKLNVNGAFHSPFMNGASEALKGVLETYDLSNGKIPVYANTTAELYPLNVKDTLAAQVKSPVLWQKTIENLCRNGYQIFVEVGAGTTLSSFVSKIASNVKVLNVENKESLNKTVEFFKDL